MDSHNGAAVSPKLISPLIRAANDAPRDSQAQVKPSNWVARLLLLCIMRAMVAFAEVNLPVS